MAEYSGSSGYAEYEYLGTANGTSFAKRHPYLLWQIIGWSILLADAVFFVVAALQDFGEWCYPVIVFPFIAALFAVIGSPFLIYFSRKAKIPAGRHSKREASVVRSHITMISQIRGESHPVLMALLIIALALGLLVLTLQLRHARLYSAWIPRHGGHGGRAVRGVCAVFRRAEEAVHGSARCRLPCGRALCRPVAIRIGRAAARRTL